MEKEFNFWEEIEDELEKQFPKGECKERGNALVLCAIFHLKFDKLIRLLKEFKSWNAEKEEYDILLIPIKKFNKILGEK